jgi:hypothetical protein
MEQNKERKISACLVKKQASMTLNYKQISLLISE